MSRASRSSGSPLCFFFTSLLHQSVTRGMSGRDRGMSVREWVERDESAIIVGEGRDAG